MPVSERIERSSVVEAQRRATSSLVNPGRLDSASESSVEIKLPDLPKI
jgi:hypothetical protein